jgi:HK97 gp10 family phage protein
VDLPGAEGVKGKDAHIRRLRNLTKVERAANRVVMAGAEMIRAEAHHSISAGSVSGKNHIPSAPGEPPNRDTGVLQANIETLQPGALVAEVRSSAEYAAALELGTSKMAARPYMRPARDKMAPEIQRLFAQEIGKLVKRSGR